MTRRIVISELWKTWYFLESTWEYKVNKIESSRSHRQPANLLLDLGHELLSPGGGDLYHEQYDEHGVRIERRMSDAELLQYYIG